jgi:predicted Fe-S protein YdhL (DUF1289 family)
MSKSELAQGLGPPIESPCIKQCTLDASGAYCTGCGRTRHEIALWSSMTHAERLEIMATLPARLKRT